MIVSIPKETLQAIYDNYFTLNEHSHVKYMSDNDRKKDREQFEALFPWIKREQPISPIPS